MMDSSDNRSCGPDDLELPAAKKICLENNDVSNTSRDNSILSDSTLNLGNLFSPRQSLSSCSFNDGVDNTVSLPIPSNPITDEDKIVNEDENNVFDFSSSEMDKKSDISTVMSDLNNTPSCVKIIEDNKNNCSSESKLNASNLSTKAFNIDESLDFMDETCLDNHSDDCKGNLVSMEVKSLTDLAEKNDKTTMNIPSVENCITEDCINLMTKSDGNCSSQLEVTLDYTCKPEVMGGETQVLCQSTITKDAISARCTLFLDPSLTSMSIDESLVSGMNTIPCQPTQEFSSDSVLKMPSMEQINFDDSDCEKISNNSNSTNLFNEVSGCALDYTCSKSVCFDFNETSTEGTLTNKVSEKTINAILECSDIGHQDINKSNSVMMGCENLLTENNVNIKDKNYLNSTENNVPDPDNPIYDLSDLKNSFMLNKTFSAEEVNFLKENLLKVMELLKIDNISFESYKLASECEKRELLERIRYLESNSTRHLESSTDISSSQKTSQDGKNDQSGNCSMIYEELSKTRLQYNDLLQLVLVTEASWRENKLLIDFLSDLNISHNELFIPLIDESNGYIINHKKIYDLMLSLSKEIVKSNSFKKECYDILTTFIESSKTNESRLSFIPKECENDLVGNLKTTFEEILNNINCLEKENSALKLEIGNMSNEIRSLSSTIENLNHQLNITKENSVISADIIVKDKCNNAMETTHNLSNEVADKFSIHDSFSESNTKITEMKDSVAALKKALSLSEENYNNVSFKCEKYEIELKKMREVEHAYQELLLHHNVLKTEIDSKYCEIENLNAENKHLIELKTRFETAHNSSIKIGDNDNEILVTYDDQTSKDLSLNNVEIPSFTNDRENIMNEFKMSQNNASIKEDLVELQENHDCLKTQFVSSKDEILKLQSDLSSLNEKYTEVLSIFDLYKQKYTYTEEEFYLEKEEKRSLERELDSLKSQLENALEESSRLKNDNEIINNKIENLVVQLSDLETANSNLETQLSGMHSDSDNNVGLLTNEISELKVKLDSMEKLLLDHEEKQNELKLSYDKVCEDLESKKSHISLLTDNKEKLEKELEIFSLNDTLLKQRMEELEENRNCLETQIHSSKNEISKLQFDFNCLNEMYSELSSNFDVYKQKYTFTEDESILWKEEKQSMKFELDSLKSQLESALEESSKHKSDNEIMNTKIEDLLVQLSDLETANDILKTELSGMHSDSNHNADLLNNEISELKVKLDSTEKMLLDNEEKHIELKVSYDKICEDLESKNLDLSLVTDTNEKLEKDLEMYSQNDTLLKQKIEELQANCDNLEVQLLSSKEEFSKLQSSLNFIKEKHTEVSTNFDLHKEKYIFTEDELISWKQEKQSLKCELESLQSKLGSALEESTKLKFDNEEINNNFKNLENQLCNEKQNCKDIQESYQNLKTKYEESIVEINNKTIELQSLLTQLSDIETINASLKTQISCISESDYNIDLLNNEIIELKKKLGSTEKLVVDNEEKYSEFKITYDKVCEDLESKNSDLSLLTDAKEKLEKELEIYSQNDILLKQKIKELQENRDCLETQLLSSKDDISKLQLDFNCLNEKYSELISNFDLFKQKYTFTEDESILWKEEKQSLECELDSLKSQLESALEESSKLKCHNEEISNNLMNMEDQLSSEKQSSKDIQNSYDNLKIKYEDSVVEINNKTTEIQNLLAQLSDLETSNGNLKNELNSVRSESENNRDLLNNEIIELNKKLDVTEKLVMCNEEKHNELKVSYDRVCEDLESKNSDLSLLTDTKEKLEKELEIYSQNDTLLQQKIKELQENRDCLETQLLSSKDDVSKLQLDFNCLNEKYSELISNFEVYKKKYTFTEDESILWKEEKQSLECELNSVQSQLESALEESTKLKCDNEEINNNFKNLENQLYNEKQSSKVIQESYENLKKKYEESIVDINNKTIELQSLLAQLSDLETTNANLKIELTNFFNNADINTGLLNNEISELKLKLDSTEKLLIDYREKHNELKITYDKVCEDLKSKNSDLSLLTDAKEKLEKELEIYSQNDILLKQKIEELQENRDCLETQLLSSKDSVSKLQLDFNCLNEKYSELISNFDLYKQKYTFTEDESILWKEEKQSLECELNSLNSQLESALEESSKLKCHNEEISNNLMNMEDQLYSEKQSSKDIQNSYDNLKIKYEDSVVEINNKTTEIQNLLAQLLDLETSNGNLKNELNSVRSESENNRDLLNNEIIELNKKLDVTEKLVMCNEEKHNELKVSYDRVCEDLESKNSDLSLLTDTKEKLEKELEIYSQNDTLLKQKIEVLQENRDCLETQLLSSKDDVSKLQLDFNCLSEKYSELISNFDLYKQKYTFTEDESILWKEEKQALECKLDSVQSQLGSVLEELQTLKSDYEETSENLKNVENQLCDEKQSCRNIESSLENLKKEFLELNRKYEASEKCLIDLQEKHNELKVSSDLICEALESKKTEYSLLTNCKEQLEKEIDTLSQTNLSLKQKLKDVEKYEECHQKEMLDFKFQLDSANSKIDCMKNIEMQVDLLKKEYDILSLYHTQNKEICGEQPFCLFSEFINTVKAVIKDLIFFKSKCSEEETKLSSSQEEVSRLNVLLDSLKEEIKVSTEESVKLQENYSSLSKQYNSLLDSSQDSNIRCNSLLEKLKELESQNSLCKSAIQDLKSEVSTKESVIVSLSNIKELYESTAKENKALSSQLMQKIEEYETALDKIKNSEQKYVSLELEYNTLESEINDLRNKNLTLELKCSENYALYISGKDNIESLQKEKEEIRKNFIKCEKDYQNSLDLVKKCQENMGNLDKQYNLSIAKLNVILKEKESYESQNLSLQKINDELVNRIKELNFKCQENENVLTKFKELEKSYEIVSNKHQSLAKQLIDYGNLKSENEILKSRISERDSFFNNLSINYNELNEKYNSLSDELKKLSAAVLALVPGENSAMEIIKVIGEKLQGIKKIEIDLQEEKIKCENLDEECNLLNEDLKYKDVVIGDMYKDHSSKMNELQELLKKEENLRQEILLENSTLKDKIKCLDSEIFKLKTTEQSACSSCAELKGVLQKLKMDLVDNSSKVTTLQLQIEENEITNKKKIHDYRKKISSLQEELGAALNKLEDNRLKSEIACFNASVQTEILPVQISGQSGIVQSFKIKEQEEKIKKFEKENLVLKRMCQSRLQTIQDLKTKLENVSKPQKNQRNVLEEVQNQQST
ncbi:unnamed protein product [Nezara viridula]|uniref:Uncharacterized protein n=1 Tax=Nezara viridula TaxID=85310 RepID=A0A9P0HJK9_NEZVI|nr:unnamed protein product [Nezara viridula]